MNPIRRILTVTTLGVCLWTGVTARAEHKTVEGVLSFLAPVAANPTDEITLEEFVKRTFPELKLLFPSSSSVHELINDLSDLIKTLENPDPNQLGQLSRAIKTLASMKPETLEGLLKSAPKDKAKAEALMKKLIESKRLGVEALAAKLRDGGKESQAERLVAYFALVEKMGAKKMNVAAVISPKTLDQIRELLPKMREEIAPLVKKHKQAFLKNDPKAKAAFFKELGDKLLEWDKKNGGTLALALDPNGTADLVKLLRKVQKESGIPKVEGHLYLPKVESDKLYATLVKELTLPLVEDIRKDARGQALHGVNSQRIPPRIRAGATVGAPEGAAQGALDGAFGRPHQAPRATGRIHIRPRKLKYNYGYGENRGYNEAYAAAYAQATEQRLAGEKEMRDSVKLMMEDLVNKNFEGMGSLQVHYLNKNKSTDGEKLPDYSYLSFFEGKDTFASFRLGAIDRLTAPDLTGITLLEKIVQGKVIIPTSDEPQGNAIVPTSEKP